VVEFEFSSFLIYLGLEVGDLRGEEALEEYKRPPPPLILHPFSFYDLPYVATLLKFLGICYWNS